MIQLNWTAENGLNVPGAIHKVLSAQLNGSGEATFQMGVFVDTTNRTPVEVRGYNFSSDPEGADLFSQCYAHALTLPEYAGAVVL